jgi:Mce-associated membrane protein
MSDDAPTPADEPAAKPTPLTKAQKLEAKAAKLREADAARAARPEPSPGTHTMIPWIAAVVVLVIALVGTVIYASHEQGKASDARHASASAAKLDSLRTSALTFATTVSTSFGTYDYQTLPADFARTRAYLTAGFASDFGQLTASLGSLITQAKGKTVAKVQGVGLQSLKPPSAVVLVFLDQTVTSAESSTPRIDHNRLRLTLALQPDGTHWLVSKLELV